MITFVADGEKRDALYTVLSDLFFGKGEGGGGFDLVYMLIVENSWSLLIGLLVVVAFAAGSWWGSPKGENQT